MYTRTVLNYSVAKYQQLTKDELSSSMHTGPLGQEHSFPLLYINMLPTIVQSKSAEQRYNY